MFHYSWCCSDWCLIEICFLYHSDNHCTKECLHSMFPSSEGYFLISFLGIVLYFLRFVCFLMKFCTLLMNTRLKIIYVVLSLAAGHCELFRGHFGYVPLFLMNCSILSHEILKILRCSCYHSDTLIIKTREKL